MYGCCTWRRLTTWQVMICSRRQRHVQQAVNQLRQKGSTHRTAASRFSEASGQDCPCGAWPPTCGLRLIDSGSLTQHGSGSLLWVGAPMLDLPDSSS